MMSSMDPVGWLAYGAATAMRVTILMLLTFSAAAALRKRSAAERHLVWATAMVGSLVLAGYGAAPLEWRISLPDAADSANAGRAVGRWLSDGGGEGLRAPLPNIEARAGREVLDVGEPVTVGLESTTSPGRLLGWALMTVWLMGVVVISFRAASGQARAFSIARESPPWSEGQLGRRAAGIARELGIRRPVTILRGWDEMPRTGGVLRPWLMVPVTAAAWPARRQERVLRHELAHVARQDILWEMVIQAACALYWPHPLVWIAGARLRVAREHACDDIVLLSGAGPPVAYAEDLLEVARGVRDGRLTRAAALAMARPSSLRDRLAALLDERPRVVRVGGGVRFGAACGGLVVVALLGGSRPLESVLPEIPVELAPATQSQRVAQPIDEGDQPVMDATAAERARPTAKPIPATGLDERSTGSFEAREVPPAEPPAPVTRREASSLSGVGYDVRATSPGPEYLRLSGAPRPPLPAGANAGVSYSVTARLSPTARGSLPLPPALLSSIHRDSHLATLRLESRAGGSEGTLTASFGFADIGEFHDWYLSGAIREFHAALTGAAVAGGVEVTLDAGEGR